MHFLMQLRTQGKTTIIVTHDVEFVAESKPRIILMADGKVTADGSLKGIMSDLEKLNYASVAPPEISKVFHRLSNFGLPGDVMDVEEAVNIVLSALEADK